MKHLFLYNWQVREEWMNALQHLSHEELVKERTGGVGSILKTFFHIVDVEYSWIQVLRGDSVVDPNYEDYQSLERVMQLSRDYHERIHAFITEDTLMNRDHEVVNVPWSEEQYYFGEVLRHIIAHEIHHIGQMSVWAKEVGLKNISANFIGRGLMNK